MRYAPSQSYSFVLTLVVAAVVAAGMIAFLTATPGKETRIASSALGFRTLDRDWLDDRFAALADARRAAAREQAQRIGSGRIARSWLASLTAGRASAATAKVIAVAPNDAAARARISALQTWAGGIDPRVWAVAGGAADSVVGTTTGTWQVDAVITIVLADAKQRTHRQRIPVVVELAPPVTRGGRWRVRDLQVDAPSTGVRAYRKPRIIHREGVDVVMPASLAMQATGIANTVHDTLGELQTALGDRMRIDVLAVYGWSSEAQLRAAVGADRAAMVLASDRVVASDGDGNLAVHAPQWLQLDAADRTGAIRSAMFEDLAAHSLAMLPRAIVDGTTAALLRAPDADDMYAARVEGGGRSIEQLLVADPASELEGDAERARAHMLGSWLLTQHSLRVLDRLADQHDAGVDSEHAIRRVLHATPAGVAQRVLNGADASPTATREQQEDGA